MHQALDRSAKPETASQSGFNPLQRTTRSTGKRWWIITAAALLASAFVLILPHIQFTSEPVTPEGSGAQMTGEASLTRDTKPLQSSSTTDETVIDTPHETTEVVSLLPVVDTMELLVEATESFVETKESPVKTNEEANRSPVAASAVSASFSADQDPPEPVTSVESRLESEPLPVVNPSTAESTESMPAYPKAATVNTRQEPAPNETGALTTAADKPSRVESQSRISPAPAAEAPVSSVARAVPRHTEARQAVQDAISRNNMARAQVLLAAWIEREPTLEEPRLWLAKINLGNGRQRDAEALLIGLQSPEALALRGLILEQTERFADAARLFETLTRNDSGNPQWWLHWAINLENSGRMEEARLLYQTYLQQFSSHNARLTAFASDRYRALTGS
jgi:thioredoxin-like negative regulator of GroEL